MPLLTVVDLKTGEERIQDSRSSFEDVVNAEKVRRDRYRRGKYVRFYVKNVLTADKIVDADKTAILEKETVSEMLL